jgi:hypothetical protein
LETQVALEFNVLIGTFLQAIAEQRKNEEIMGSNFNKRKDKDLR